MAMLQRTGLLLVLHLLLTITLSGFTRLPGFQTSPYFNEQVLTFQYYPEVRIHINAPSAENFNPSLPTVVALFALPNGNTIEQTVGKKLKAGDDWHYDIQHIGAQTRFVRAYNPGYNLVTVYLESAQKSWPTWKSKYANSRAIISAIVDSCKNIFAAYNPSVVLTGHSGGGSFIFGYLDFVSAIPSFIKRICFLDSNYGYDDTYAPKFVNWLNASSANHLSILAYNDSVALLNGQPVVSPTGGTWYRTRMMVRYLSTLYTFSNSSDSIFIAHRALGGRIAIILKQNPARAILHTVQVELNGFIQTMVSGTALEGSGYTYYGARAYPGLIQSATELPRPLNIPPRPSGAMTGSQFMQFVMNMTFEQREAEIYKEISKGNIPEFLRALRTVTTTLTDASGTPHQVILEVMPDYLAIGSDEDYCRVPTGPATAQRLANLFGAVLPTPKLVDTIYTRSELKVAPVTYTPVGNQNELVPKFIQHNTAIDSQRAAAGRNPGVWMGGTKKDVVLSNKITDPTRPGHVVIYGWHQLNGAPIQPVTNIHIGTYTDYSHGIRFLNNELLVDSALKTITAVLKDAVLYKLLSNETGAMTQPSYLADTALPAAPKSFGVLNNGPRSLAITVKPDPSVTEYRVETGYDGALFTQSRTLSPDSLFLYDLPADSILYVRLKAVNSYGSSEASEVLGGTPLNSTASARVLVVHAFDRATTGNTKNFTRLHLASLLQNSLKGVSCTNEAITDGLVVLQGFELVDWVLGDESTADETFSTAEQGKVKLYLAGGGSLITSGSEIAWDLDSKGTATDKDFCNNFLKTAYFADAPNNQAGVYYRAEPAAGSWFAGLPPFYFDDGTHGTINVRYPDVFKPAGGGNPFMKYYQVDTSLGYAGISYSGVFPNGIVPGKVAVSGIPLESVYPDFVRHEVFRRITAFMGIAADVKDIAAAVAPAGFTLYTNYPNPFNGMTVIHYYLTEPGETYLRVFNVNGEVLIERKKSNEPAGMQEAGLNLNTSPSGIYICELTTTGRSGKRARAVQKMLLVK